MGPRQRCPQAVSCDAEQALPAREGGLRGAHHPPRHIPDALPIGEATVDLALRKANLKRVHGHHLFAFGYDGLKNTVTKATES